ncbi:hypothetical protein N665_3694s0002 [Sinapis alba]|nr:hypothetical protein N665_3694s0002 [Sinapis alba]
MIRLVCKESLCKLLYYAVWEILQKDDPDFFKEYNKRCEVARQIATFNDLLAQQVDIMHKLREIELSNDAPVTQLQQPIDQLHVIIITNKIIFMIIKKYFVNDIS